MISVNKKAHELLRSLISEEGIRAFSLENGSNVIDLTKGGLQAGKRFAEICMGGLGKVDFCWLDDLIQPSVLVSTDFPLLSCIACQYAGWKIEVEGFSTMGSGPARVLARSEEIFKKIDYRDESELGIIALESRRAPTREVSEFIAERCGISTDKLYILYAPTASIVGSIQVVARIVETGMHKLMNLNFDIRKIKSGVGTCPMPFVPKNDFEAMCLTNEYVLYGGHAVFWVEAEDREIEKIIDRIPSTASSSYGESLSELFKEGFYNLDPLLFAPAEVTINNLLSGKVYHSGKINKKMLKF